MNPCDPSPSGSGWNERGRGRASGDSSPAGHEEARAGENPTPRLQRIRTATKRNRAPLSVQVPVSCTLSLRFRTRRSHVRALVDPGEQRTRLRRVRRGGSIPPIPRSDRAAAPTRSPLRLPAFAARPSGACRCGSRASRPQVFRVTGVSGHALRASLAYARCVPVPGFRGGRSYSRKARRMRARLGWRSLRSAFASIWRIRSRVTSKS